MRRCRHDAPHQADRTDRVRHPIVQTGMGYVSGARLTAATATAGGLGIIASSTMSLAELESAIHEVKERTDAPFGVNIRSDAADAGDRVSLLICEQVAVASFRARPQARAHRAAQGRWHRDDPVHRRQAACGSGQWAQTRCHRCRAVKAAGTPERCRRRSAAPGRRRGGHPVIAAGGFFDGRGLVAATAPKGSPWAPASCAYPGEHRRPGGEEGLLLAPA